MTKYTPLGRKRHEMHEKTHWRLLAKHTGYTSFTNTLSRYQISPLFRSSLYQVKKFPVLRIKFDV